MIIDSENPKQLMLIINPVSGKKTGQRFALSVVDRFMQYGYIVSVFVTDKRGDATLFIERFGHRYDEIVSMGGDGTLNESMTGIVRAGLDVPLGYLPCGSTNDFASCHNLSPDLLIAAGNAAMGKVESFDVGQFGSTDGLRYFAYVAAFGAFSWLSYTTPQNMKNVFGHTAYIFDAIKELSMIKSEHLKITADGEEHEGDYIFGAICNSTSVAGVMTIPRERVDMSDGLFEILLVKMPANPAELQADAVAIINQNYNAKGIEFFRAKSIVVETRAAMQWSLDGELALGGPRLEVENLPRRLKLKF